MNAIRGGKIARLPPEIREQINRRLANHESSTRLLEWLNALPEIQKIIAQEFGGETISRQNVHNWRRGGFAEWQREESARGLMAQLSTSGNGLAEQGAGAVLETMTTFAAARYVVSMKRLEGKNDGEGLTWERLREFCGDLAALRRGEQLAARLEFEREKVRGGLIGGNAQHLTFNTQR